MVIAFEEINNDFEDYINNLGLEPLEILYKEKKIVIINVEVLEKNRNMVYNGCTDSCTENCTCHNHENRTTVNHENRMQKDQNTDVLIWIKNNSDLIKMEKNELGSGINYEGKNMRAINYTNIRENFKMYCDAIVDDSEAIIVTRKNNRNVVMISEETYNNMQENMYLRESKENYNRLLSAKNEIEAGSCVVETMEL